MKRKLHNLNHRGFTLIELLLYVALCTFFLTIVSQIFLASLDIQSESESYVATELDGRYILSRITNDVHRATAITQPAAAGSGDTLALTIGGTSYQYATSGASLLLTSPLGANMLNSVDTTVSDFLITRVGAGGDTPSVIVRVTVTAKTIPTEGTQTKTYETTIGLR